MTTRKLLDKATSSENVNPDWESILAICDKIRSNVEKFKNVLPMLKKKLHDRNPHVQRFALMVLEACMKNCGSTVHDEVATKAFMSELVDILQSGVPPLVKDKILELVQAWKHAFRGQLKYNHVEGTYETLRLEGYQFPTLVESDAMFSAELPPDWVDDKHCHLCRKDFSTFTRKHHCRNCGKIFCQECSSKESLIPKFGFETPVRVCDICWGKLDGKNAVAGATPGMTTAPGGARSENDGDLPVEYLQSTLAKEAQTPPVQNPARERELQEEEELQIAMAMSLNEEENKKKASKSSAFSGSSGSGSHLSGVSTSASASPAHASTTSSSSGSRPSAYDATPSYQPAPTAAPSYHAPPAAAPPSERRQPAAYDAPPQQAPMPALQPVAAAFSPAAAAAAPAGTDQDLNVLKSSLQNSIDMFVDRMQSVSGQGRNIAMDASVQALFHSISAMHPPLLAAIEEQDNEKGHYVDLEKKLQEAKEARVSLNAMRRTHSDKIRQQQSELEMLARLQMQQKLELLRQQKNEQLEHMDVLRKQRNDELQRQLQQQQEFETKQQAEAQQSLVYQQQQLLQEQQAQIHAMSAALIRPDPSVLPPNFQQPGVVQPPPQQFQPGPPAQQQQQQSPPQQSLPMQQAAPAMEQPPPHAQQYQQPSYQQPPPQQQQQPLPQQQHLPAQQIYQPQQQQPQQQQPQLPTQSMHPTQSMQAPIQYVQQPPAQMHAPSAVQQVPNHHHQQQLPIQQQPQPVEQQYNPAPAAYHASYGYESNLMPVSGPGMVIPATGGVSEQQQLISFD